MYDSSFNSKTLAREIRRSDFGKIPKLYTTPGYLDGVIAGSYKKVTASLPSLKINTTKIKRKDVYKIDDIEDDLIIRKINSNIKVLTGVRQGNRDGIVSNIIKLLEETVSYRIYRLDIEKFYESISVNDLLVKLYNDSGITRDTIKLIKAFFMHFNTLGASGVPRGLPLSATLAEYCMRAFDKKVSTDINVQFYARFVDDIIIITNGNEDSGDFFQKIEGYLFSGLRFNKSPLKRSINSVTSAVRDTTGAQKFDFSFLGYKFTVFNPSVKKARRVIKVDLASNKIKKIKMRLVKAFLAYLLDGDYGLLKDRVKLLSSNFLVFDVDKSITRKAGIFYSYPQVTENDSVSGLGELDSFLKKAIISKKGKIFSKLHAKLNKMQRKDLLGMSFVRGFSNRVIYDFPSKRLNRILECWAHD